MSVVADFVRRLDEQVDAIPPIQSPLASALKTENGEISAAAVDDAWARVGSGRVQELLVILKGLSDNSALSPSTIRDALHRAKLAQGSDAKKDPFEEELEWQIVKKATAQIQALVFQALLDDILPLEDNIDYWNEVLESPWNKCILLAQTLPGRALTGTHTILRDAWTRRNTKNVNIVNALRFEWRWRSVDAFRHRIESPIQKVAREAKEQRANLQRVLDARAAALGRLILSTSQEFGVATAPSSDEDTAVVAWQGLVAAHVDLVETVLGNARLDSVNLKGQFDRISPENKTKTDSHQPTQLGQRLVAILDTALDTHSKASKALIADSRKPSVLARYWLPALVGVLSSSTILRFFFRHRTTIITSIKESGATMHDFWFNWVVDPVRHLVNTIRRDPGSEVVLLSKASLVAERESLERMVVDFVKDHPQYVEEGLKNVSDAQLADIRAKVMEGDITPVLRAYEFGLKKPFQRALAGELIESLLIRVQKVEVVLEATIKGVDSLLEQQQLLFGIIGLAPGMLAVGGAFMYLRKALSTPSARSLRNARQGAVAKARFMREAGRLVLGPTPSGSALPDDSRRGLLLVEAHRLRALVKGRMPAEVEKMLLADLDELVYTTTGQGAVLDRIWRAYGPWLHWLQ